MLFRFPFGHGTKQLPHQPFDIRIRAPECLNLMDSDVSPSQINKVCFSKVGANTEYPSRCRTCHGKGRLSSFSQPSFSRGERERNLGRDRLFSVLFRNRSGFDISQTSDEQKDRNHFKTTPHWMDGAAAATWWVVCRQRQRGAELRTKGGGGEMLEN